MYFRGIEQTHVHQPIGFGQFQHGMKAGNLRRVGGDQQLAAIAVGNAVIGAEAIKHFLAAPREAGFQATRHIAHARVNAARVA